MQLERPAPSADAQTYLARTQKLLIGDRWVEGTSDRQFDVENQIAPIPDTA